MKSRIHYTKPSITELEVAYATDAAAANGWGDRCYRLPNSDSDMVADHF
jgi:perosamine synthetase